MSKQGISPFYHDLDLDLVGLIGNFFDVEQLLLSGCQATSELNFFIQSCYKEYLEAVVVVQILFRT